MSNLWILTEERPKNSVIKLILDEFALQNNTSVGMEDLSIVPSIDYTQSPPRFNFLYTVNGIQNDEIDNIYIKVVKGHSSFCDFLVFYQDEAPDPDNEASNNLILAIEETKTMDTESRNTGVYQRAIKFIHLEMFYPKVKKIMFYNVENNQFVDDGKKPSDTNIFGTNMLLTLGVELVGSYHSRNYSSYESIDDLINFKNSMRQPPKGNVPINIIKKGNIIEVSGRLAKPKTAGNIAHDPNMGSLSLISKAIRELGWTGDIVITHHGVSQQYIDAGRAKRNKFIRVCEELDIRLEGLTLRTDLISHDKYWKYDETSEKIASIFLQIYAENQGLVGIYENHAGCERSYFRTKNNSNYVIPKKDSLKNNLFIPDLVLYDSNLRVVHVIEGKMLSTLSAGVEELNNFDSFDNEVVKKYYPSVQITRWLSIYGGANDSLPHNEVLIYINRNGDIYIHDKAPEFLKKHLSV